MPFTHTWEADPNLIGNAAHQAGLGEFNARQQELAIQQQQFNARQQLAERQFAQQQVNEHFNQGATLDGIDQQDYQFGIAQRQAERARQFELLRDNLGFNQDIQKLQIGAGLNRGLQLELEGINQAGQDKRAATHLEAQLALRREEHDQQTMMGHWEALLKSSDMMTDQQWDQAYGQAIDYWDKRGQNFPSKIPRPMPQPPPTNDPEIAAIRQAHPELNDAPLTRNPKTGKIETPDAWVIKQEQKRLAQEAAEKEQDKKAADAEKAAKDKADKEEAHKAAYIRDINAAWSAANDKDTGLNVNQFNESAKRIKANYERIYGTPMPDVDKASESDEGKGAKAPEEQIIATPTDGSGQVFLSTREELIAHKKAHPGSKYVTLGGRVLQ